MKQRYRNVNLEQRNVRGKSASQKWLVQLKKTGAITRKARRDER